MVVASISVIFICILLYFIKDYYGPREVKMSERNVFGFASQKAKNLIVHEYDNEGNLFASRGLVVYKLRKGTKSFFKIARLKIGLSLFWFGNFSLFRKWLNKPECMELTVGNNGKMTAFSAGFLYFQNSHKNGFIRSLKLPYFGIGIGRGIMSTGILNLGNGCVYIGEYFRNQERASVHIYQSLDYGRNWNIAYTFPKGEIRHIHAIQRDPFTNKLWVCTGDEDKECMIAFSEDGFKSIEPIGSGSQQWRTCQLVFKKEAVYWGTDTGDENVSGIYRWDKQSHELDKIYAITGAIFFGTKLKNGNLIMSTDRENFPNEKDDKTRLYMISDKDSVTEVECGKWKNKRPNFKFSFAKSRLQRNQGGHHLAVNFINQKGLESSDLYLISEDEINRFVSEN